ncbi:MAG TPA: tetratricopeptide repeat-containing diguanylate cyclase [Pedomonas sp.]|uniref:tetratricopeptide repeat-containing diguanylate cyclase n=1 Tax=Pedomonas sp. TaxID=2976421 RepID=UPI002F425953
MFSPPPLRRLTASALLLAAGLGASSAGASVLCVETPDPKIAALSRQVGQDPHAALRAAQQRLETDKTLTSQQKAWLHAVRAAGYWALSRVRDTKEESAIGLELVPDPKDPAHVQLLILNGQADFRMEAIRAAIPRFEAARAHHDKESDESLCLQIALADALLQTDQIESAVSHFQEAYVAGQAPGREQQRVHAAMALGQFMRYAGDFEQALALLAEQTAWDKRHGHTHGLSNDYYFVARYHRLAGRPAEAVQYYAQSRRLSAPFGDTVGDAYIDLEWCMALTDMGRLHDATARCEAAAKVFVANGEEAEAEAHIQMAEIALKKQQPARALALLNGVFQSSAVESTAISIMQAYRYRAEAQERLGNHAQAYADLAEYLRQFTRRNEVERTRQMAAQRALVQINRQIERNEALRRELEVAKDRQQQQARQLVLMFVVGVLLIGGLLSGYLVSRRHQLALQEVARKDSLTGLNNRRRTVELAKSVFYDVAETRRPVAVAIIDLDHFKQINDRWGHAAGDAVLIAFAETLKQAVRPQDIIGRWGGEEFLVILPNTGAEAAAEVIERTRSGLAGCSLSFTSDFRATFSAGLAVGFAPEDGFRILLDRADDALYRAKAEGRDRTCLYQPWSEREEPGPARLHPADEIAV